MRVRLIIGLGNPGADYENTYHNAGMMALTAIAETLSGGEELHWKNHKKLFASAENGHWVFIRPLTFMNESGGAVREAARKFAIPSEHIILLHDDSDLPLGAWKIARGRGAAGHHGVESVITSLGANDFTRIRIGIRPRDERVRKKAGTFVLRKVTKIDGAIFKKIFGEISQALGDDTIVV